MNEKSIPPELRFLVDAERSRPDAPADARGLAQAKLAALLGLGAGLGGGGSSGGSSSPGGGGSATGSAGAGAASGGASGGVGAIKGVSGISVAKALAVFAMGGLVGGGVAKVVIRPTERVVYVERTAPAVTAPQSPPQAPAASAEMVLPVPAQLAVPPVATVPAAVAPVRSTTRSRDTGLAAERAIIERARSALARGDGRGALVSIGQHERAFAHGQLVEEREVLAVQSLVAVGRAPEAAARGARFRKAFPSSLLLPLVDQALR